MLEATRVAARKIAAFYLKKFDYPYLFAQICQVPSQYQNLIGLDDVFVIGAHKMVTMIRGTYIGELPEVRGDGKEPLGKVVPWMPWAQQGGIGALPRDISHALRSVGLDTPVILTIDYCKGLGEALVKAGNFKMAKKNRWPAIELTVKAIKTPGGGRDLGKDGTPEELVPFFIPKTMAEADKKATIHLRSITTGQLMQGHDGTIEWRGHDRPVLLKSSCGNMVSILQPAPRPEIMKDETPEEAENQQALPGLFDPRYAQETQE